MNEEQMIVKDALKAVQLSGEHGQLKSGIVVVPGEGFGEYGEGFFRVSIVCSEEELYEIIRRMEEDGFFYE